jgi:CRP/FNR family transcriptional regulator
MLTTPGGQKVLVNLFHQGARLTYQKGEFVIRPGDSPSGIYYISSGLVKAYDITKYGEENLLTIRKAGEVLGLTKALTGEKRRILYGTLAPTEILHVSQEMFETFLQDYPEAALPLLDMVSEMYRLHSERILNLEYRTVRERLISFLLIIERRFGEPSPDGMILAVPLRHQDIASSISATRETTSRELAYLEHQGLISRERSSFIVLHDLDKLRSYLE